MPCRRPGEGACDEYRPHPEELAKQASRRMDTTHGLAAILRDARKGALLRMRSEINSQPLEPVNDADLIRRSLRSKRLEGWIQRTRGHPSRRAQGRAPQDEVGDIFTTSQ